MASRDREPVTRDRAIRKAVELADEGGLESLSMRRLATALGIEAMSLYHHVPGKADILDGMLDLVHAEYGRCSAGDPWRPAMRARADTMRRVLARHPWALSIASRTSPGPATLGHLDSVIGCLRAAGFSMPLVGHAMSLLDSYVQGFAQQESSLPLDPAGDIAAATEEIIAQQASMAEAFPHLAAMAQELILRPGYSYGAEFDVGIELILEGIDALLRAEADA